MATKTETKVQELKINYLSDALYKQAVANGDINENEIYLTPDYSEENNTNISAGSATKPVYFSEGNPVACSYSLNKTVPSDAKFTDTTYSNFVKSGSSAKAGLVPAPSTTAGTTKYLREDGTWAVPPDTDTKYEHPTTAGNKHIPSGGSSGQILKWSSSGTATWATPDSATDTKVTNTLATTTKAYVTGTTSSSTNTGTQVFDTGVYLGTTSGELVATTFTGKLSGNASSATKLNTSRTIRTNLASTSTASFDGSANITPGVTGTLPVANGGTGATTASTALSNLGGAPTSHATSSTTYGAGTSSNYGHVKLSDSISSTSGASSGIAATPSAVKSAYDAVTTLQSNISNISKQSFVDKKNGTLSSSTINSSNPSSTAVSLFTAPDSGLYTIDGYVDFSSNANGNRFVRLSTQMGGFMIGAASGTVTRIPFNQTIHLSKSTEVSINLAQSSGSSVSYGINAKYAYIKI